MAGYPEIDFTLKVYRKLLEVLCSHNYKLCRIDDQKTEFGKNTIFIRQDVDSKPENSLAFARIQNELGIRSTFYFRITPVSFNKGIIEEIQRLGHQIGYHYEEMSLAARISANKYGLKGHGREEEIAGIAMELFERNLEKIRYNSNVDSICMHGSPFSSWDSRLIWKYYDYATLDIKSEPYFDFCFEESLYLTDTARRWDGDVFSSRDKLNSLINTIHPAGNIMLKNDANLSDPFQDWIRKPIIGSLLHATDKAAKLKAQNRFRTTSQIIAAALTQDLPGGTMMTFHPQRWTDKGSEWLIEMISQNLKNPIKYILNKLR